MRVFWIAVPVLAVVAFPAVARACDPCKAADLRLLDDAQGGYPSNGLVVSSYSPDTLVVTVDGMDATLDPVPIAWPTGPWEIEQHAYRVAPEPQPGGAVEIVPLESESCFGEPPDQIAYAAGPGDDAPPAAPSALEFDLHVFPTEDDEAMCRYPPEAVYWLRGELAVIRPRRTRMRLSKRRWIESVGRGVGCNRAGRVASSTTRSRENARRSSGSACYFASRAAHTPDRSPS